MVGFHAASLGLVVLLWSGSGWLWTSLQGNGGGWWLSPISEMLPCLVSEEYEK
jgi:hypothetical protein